MPTATLNWTTLNDFRAGIKGRVTPDDISRSVTRVIGVADKNNTYRCWALPDGSLAPLPKRTYGLVPTLPFTSSDLEQNRFSISGFHAAGPLIGGDEFHIAYEGIADVVGSSPAKTIGARYYYWDRIRHFDADQRDNLFKLEPAAATPPRTGVEGYAQPTYFHSMRMHPTDPLQVGIPVVVASWRESSGSRFWKTFPDPATPTLNTLKNLATFAGGAGDLPTTVFPYYGFAHQGRACIITISVFDHGTVSAHPWVDNEQVWFTNFNLPTIQSTAGTTFGMENATGYSAAMSTSFSELFLIKNVMGGLLVRDSIDDFTALRLPGIPGLSNVKHIPVSCPLGAVFMNDAGAWLWAGGETAEPISRDALTGDDLKPQINHVETDFDSFYGRIGFWHDWVIFPNNWAWNFADRSWWRFENPSDFRMFWVGPEETGAANLFCAPPWVQDGGIAVAGFNYYTQADSYRWKSLPLPLGRERENKIREYVLVTTGQGDVTVTFTNLDGSTQADTFAVNSTSPQYIRKESNVRCEHLVVQLDVTTSGVTPIVHELRLGIADKEHMPSGTP